MEKYTQILASKVFARFFDILVNFVVKLFSKNNYLNYVGYFDTSYIPKQAKLIVKIIKRQTYVIIH